ncbi:helix-turn-helix transcriptional regulator [Sinomicrobium weinanense]|uniref:Transcriptional regulator n=1 Tax=Sinomicrobium weinanense TaxID=2842200 RepID=A0A926Q292_9FLAO|nr:metalloregulator ArsR/SmtB family transcription factor [Sinomicrobium weinanense]MBC9796268.1 transcriptional regulator [Sinomicrobium weinanense]MBU3122277.1 transcriptional regulator [Sinomicrobium weinanense]
MKKDVSENEKAIWILKNQGPKSLKEIAVELGITTEGARFQLMKLSGEGLVKSESISRGRGRPQQIWSLTEKGHSRFPDMHGHLTVKLIQTIRESLGENALDKVIASAGEDNIKKYSGQMQEAKDLEEKIRILARIREEEGYMAHYEKTDEGYLLLENHCPICEAAKACQNFCSTELRTFQTVLGDEAVVKRVDHILAGARRCAYLIKT